MVNKYHTHVYFILICSIITFHGSLNCVIVMNTNWIFNRSLTLLDSPPLLILNNKFCLQVFSRWTNRFRLVAVCFRFFFLCQTVKTGNSLPAHVFTSNYKPGPSSVKRHITKLRQCGSPYYIVHVRNGDDHSTQGFHQADQSLCQLKLNKIWSEKTVSPFFLLS